MIVGRSYERRKEITDELINAKAANNGIATVRKEFCDVDIAVEDFINVVKNKLKLSRAELKVFMELVELTVDDMHI